VAAGIFVSFVARQKKARGSATRFSGKKTWILAIAKFKKTAYGRTTL
jgi:hypothetical protein